MSIVSRFISTSLRPLVAALVLGGVALTATAADEAGKALEGALGTVRSLNN